MYQRKLEKDIRCPLEYGMELFGGKWNSCIICVLSALGTLPTESWSGGPMMKFRPE